MIKPWRVEKSATLMRDRWIDLRADDCVTAGGHAIAPYYVLTYPDWVHVVALTNDQELILVEQYRHAVGKAILELPGGMIDPADPTPLAAGQRELLEETGHAAKEWQSLGALYPNPAIQTNQCHGFRATGCQRVSGLALEAGEEGMVVRCLPVADVLAGLSSGLLGNAMHVAALLLALRT